MEHDFLNIRTFLGKHAKGTLPLLNNICFFSSYTIFRVIMWPILAYHTFTSKNHYDFDNETKEHKIVFWATCTTLVAMYGLNLFWYKFILNQVINLVMGKKVAEAPGKEGGEPKRGKLEKEKD